MKHVVYKLFWAWDFEKEEKWLNEMAAKGFLLTDVGGLRYVFQEGAPGEYRYHLEWLQHFPSHPESIAYIKFVEETGAEHVGSFKRWVYFRKKAAEGAFNLFSDLDSRITHFRRITRLIGLLSLALICYVGSLASYCLRLGYVPEPYVCMFGVHAAILTLCGVGFFKALGTYRALKRKRIVQE